jgi:hypothetical protein
MIALLLALSLLLSGCAETVLTVGGVMACGPMPMSFDRCRPVTAKPEAAR